MATTTTAKKTVNTKNQGFNPSFDNLKLRTKKNDKIYYRTVVDRKTGQPRQIENRLKDKPLFSRATMEVYGYYARLHMMDKGFVCPFIDTIAEICACSKNSVITANDALTEHNIIGIQRTGRSNSIVIVPLDDNGYPIESSPEFEVAKALNAKYRNQKSRPQKLTNQTSEVQKVNFAYNNKIQSNRRSKKLAPPQKPPSEKPKEISFEDQSLAIANCLKKIRSILHKDASDNISTTFLKNSIGKHSDNYMLWLAERYPNDVGKFCKGVHHREDYNEYDRLVVREGESQAIEENKKHTEDLNGAIEALPTLMLKSVDDSLVGQSLTPPTSELNLPINPKKEPAIKDEIWDNEDYPQGNYSNYNCSNMDCEPIEITQKRFEQAKEFQGK